MKTRYSLPIIFIIAFIAMIVIVIVYTYPESFGLTRPYSKIGEFDGTYSERAIMINEQCLDQKQNSFKDYAFAKTSNGHYYTDNVICERINVQQGGCLEPFSKGYPDENCKNRITFDYPYGETGPEFNKEFCNQVKSEPPIIINAEQNDYLYFEYLHICTIRGLIDDDLIEFQEEGNLDIVLESCACQNDPERGCFLFLAKWRNATHYIDNNSCEWELISGKMVTGSYELENPLCIGGRGMIKNENCEIIGKYDPATGIPIVENKEQCDMLEGDWDEEQNVCDSKYNDVKNES